MSLAHPVPMHWVRATSHPVIKSFEPDEDWAWCYEDEQLLERIPTFPGESPPVHYAAPMSAP